MPSKKGNRGRAVKKMARVFEVTVSVTSAEKREGIECPGCSSPHWSAIKPRKAAHL